jgi:hypothetical protein
MVIECAGDARAMGVAQGQACAAVIARLPELVLGLIPSPLARSAAARALVGPVHAAVAAGARRLMARDLAAHYPLQRARLAGIAEGAGVAERQLFVGPAVEAVLDSVSYTTPGACTAIGVAGDRAAGGGPLIAKNFDYPPAALPAYLVRVSRPGDRRAASIDLTAAPLPGCHEGVNEHGLAVAYNYGHLRGRAAARVTLTNLVQELLEECRTVGDAIDRLRRRPRRGSAILMLADAAGELASLEVAPDDVAVRRGDALVHANHAVTDQMVPRDIPADARYSRWNIRALRGRRVHESSEQRHRRAEALLAEAGALSAEDLRRALADHQGAPSDVTLCRHGPYYSTTAAVVLAPRQRAMDVLLGSPCAGAWTRLAL